MQRWHPSCTPGLPHSSVLAHRLASFRLAVVIMRLIFTTFFALGAVAREATGSIRVNTLQ